MDLTEQHLKILKSLSHEPLTLHGGRSPGSAMLTLVELGLVKETAVNLSEIRYELTEAVVSSGTADSNHLLS